MVINEKALLKAVKEEYKGPGYTVAARENEAGELVMVIEAADWLAEIEWKNVPAKLLALVVEHLKTLPTLGQAFKVQKKETNATIFNMVERMPESEADTPVIVAHRTRLMYESMEVWQKGGNDGWSCQEKFSPETQGLGISEQDYATTSQGADRPHSL